MTISPGATVQVTGQRGSWVVLSRSMNRRWHCVGKDLRTNQYVSCVVGEGDIAAVTTPASNFRPCSSVKLDGVFHKVIADEGSVLVLAVPSSLLSTRGGDNLQRPAGNHFTIAKSNLVLEELQ